MKKVHLLKLISLIAIAALFLTYRFIQNQRMQSFRDGVHAYETGNYIEAIKKITPFAKSGFEPAQHILGKMYAFGWGVEVDNALAEKWISLSCNADKTCNDGEREYYLAQDFYTGPPSSIVNQDRAIFWMNISAEKGYKPANLWLQDHTEYAPKQPSEPQ